MVTQQVKTPGAAKRARTGKRGSSGTTVAKAQNGAKVGKSKSPKGKVYVKSTDGKFVLVYQGFEDPDAKKVDQVVRTLAPARVEEVLPGTLSVEGDANRIAKVAEQLDSWSLSSEGLFSSPAPSVTRFDLP